MVTVTPSGILRRLTGRGRFPARMVVLVASVVRIVPLEPDTLLVRMVAVSLVERTGMLLGLEPPTLKERQEVERQQSSTPVGHL